MKDRLVLAISRASSRCAPGAERAMARAVRHETRKTKKRGMSKTEE